MRKHCFYFLSYFLLRKIYCVLSVYYNIIVGYFIVQYLTSKYPGNNFVYYSMYVYCKNMEMIMRIREIVY